MHREGIIRDKNIFLITAKAMNIMNIANTNEINQGDFVIKNGFNYFSIIKKITSNEYHFQSVTIPEGVNIYQVIQIFNSKNIPGNVTQNYKEGYLMPQTYFYTSLDTKNDLLTRMHNDMLIFLKENFPKNKNQYLRDINELLIFASIVEKESASISEMPIVASVFKNRLEKKMRLQSDPTALYGITLGKSSTGRRATAKDVRTKSNYNTYFINGLPPTPIACPSKSAILASMDPAVTDYLYFVLDIANGKHIFASTLAQHNANIQAIKQNSHNPQINNKYDLE